MAYQPHTLVTFGGTMREVSGQDEVWQCGIRGFQQGGGQVAAGALGDLARRIAIGDGGSGGGLSGFFGDGRGGIPASVHLRWVKAVNVGADGHYTDEPGIYDTDLDVTGINAPVVPSFCCVAISLTTGKHLGKARSGRIYPPNYGLPIATGSDAGAGGSVMDPDSMANLGAWAQDLMHTIDHSSSDDGFDFNPYIVSRSGVSNPITGIRIGNVFDTQTRRKNAVAEVYTEFALTGPSGS